MANIDRNSRAIGVKDAAEYMGIHPVSVYRLAKSGAINIRKIAGRSIILRDEIDAYLESLPTVYGEASAKRASA